jgi:hypothetical protein
MEMDAIRWSPEFLLSQKGDAGPLVGDSHRDLDMVDPRIQRRLRRGDGHGRPSCERIPVPLWRWGKRRQRQAAVPSIEVDMGRNNPQRVAERQIYPPALGRNVVLECPGHPSAGQFFEEHDPETKRWSHASRVIGETGRQP